ncbi:MAG: 16S rRNA (guanine(966)-N(2))-methyltransferase RsmD [Flavobacteriaceae bacterium]|nr:16S rRNA (guanine(966)-N(2))-methyltransferase RsmD [Flavobacteriaceae bacterium]
MRIISGTHKGRRLTAPRNLPVRPTTDFAKEGLFNILRNRLDFSSLNVLDLYAGTGNISFEFASRGVPRIVAVDAHYGCAQYIEKVATDFEFPIKAIKAEVLKYLDNDTTTFDVIFADPPYDFDIQKLTEVIGKIFQNELLSEEGILIIEHSKHIDLSNTARFQESRKYGNSVFSFFA